AAAEDARTEPGEVAAGGHGVRLAFDLGPAEGCAEGVRRTTEVAFGLGTDAAMRDLVGPHVLLDVFGRVEHRPGFHEEHRDAEVRKNLGDRTSSGAGSDYDHIIYGAATTGLLRTTCGIFASTGLPDCCDAGWIGHGLPGAFGRDPHPAAVTFQFRKNGGGGIGRAEFGKSDQGGALPVILRAFESAPVNGHRFRGVAVAGL